MITTGEQARALDIARQLIRAGVPVFAAAPNSSRPGEYHLPKGWEGTRPDEALLDRWRPGWALAAVGGHAADFLDVDPRNGGDASAEEVRAAGHWPRSFGRQATPSGGTHDLISVTGLRKATDFMPGLDLQAGTPEGGRGFVYIAPTVRRSKTTGEMAAYRWEKEPDLEGLEEWSGQDDSTEGLVSRIQAKRSAKASVPAPRQEVDLDDPFFTASTTGSTGERSFTQAAAEAWCRPHLLALRGARVGGIEEAANVAAATLSHFVPTFWSADEAFRLLTDALGHTAYDPNGPSDWTAEKFRPVLDGRRPPIDNWRATRRAEQVGTGQAEAATGSSWVPVDVGPVLRGERKRVVPELGQRQDGIPILYRGKEHAVASEPEAGKTFWVCLQVMAVLEAGGYVVYVDFEDDESTIVGRLLELGCPPEWLGPDRFRYVRPETEPRPEDLAGLFTFGPELGPDLVVYDGVTEGLGLLGLEVNSQESAADWRRLLIKPALRTGAATLSTDHVVKNKEARGRFAIGAQHKLAGLTGVMFLMECERPHGRGLKGRTRVLISKDRNGGLRQAGKPTDQPGITHLGNLVSDGETEPSSWTFFPPYEERGQEEAHDGKPRPPAQIRLTVPKVKDYLVQHPRSSTKTIKANVEARGARVDEALEWLVSNGLAVVEAGARNAKLHSLVDVFDAVQGMDMPSGQGEPTP
ncbi:hypothetical protein [Micromonospora zamorensis]|uniref:DNA primase/polymerase bifunctional N-terminal domain-containing protein n=1 Tax=Micromonospora zamorensis TaxID=709883 RepID=A0ABZ1P8B0_9ACTN